MNNAEALGHDQACSHITCAVSVLLLLLSSIKAHSLIPGISKSQILVGAQEGRDRVVLPLEQLTVAYK